MKQCALFELSMMSQNLVGKEFQKKENYTNLEGSHPQAGDGINASDIVFNKSELTLNKFLISSDHLVLLDTKNHIDFLKKHCNKFFVF